jgi:hypothetical protein
MKYLLLYLLLWISTEGGSPELTVPNPVSILESELPKVVYLAPLPLWDVCTYGQSGVVPELDPHTGGTGLLGCFIPERNTIYIWDTSALGPETHYGQQVLVHELVHWLQNRYWKPGGKDITRIEQVYTILPSLETQAYHIAGKYGADISE